MIVMTFGHPTPLLVKKFEETYKQLDISYGRKLHLDCKTQWNSTNNTLIIVMDIRICFLEHNIQKALKSQLTDEEWEFAV